MKTIRFLFEYTTGNVFIYGDDGALITTDLPEEVKDDDEIVSLYRDLWRKVDSIYENENGEFDQTKTGPFFKTVKEEMDFVREVCYFMKLLKDKLGDKYRFVDDYWKELVRYYWPEE